MLEVVSFASWLSPTHQRATPGRGQSLQCLRDVLGGENAITRDQDDVISRTRQRLDGILTSPDFAKRTLDALFTEFLGVFAPDGSPTREEVLYSLPISQPHWRTGGYASRSVLCGWLLR
jgi:hypothetical protein